MSPRDYLSLPPTLGYRCVSSHVAFSVGSEDLIQVLMFAQQALYEPGRLPALCPFNLNKMSLYRR